MFCKTIASKYQPYVGDTFPYEPGRFTWKGYYLAKDGRTYHGISFTTDNRYLSDEKKSFQLNTYLVKKERQDRAKPIYTKSLNNYWYSNTAATNWGITYLTTHPI